MGNKTTQPLSESEEPEPSKLPPSGRPSRSRDPAESIEETEDLEVAEVPPPMRPISSMPGPEEPKARVMIKFLCRHVIDKDTLRRPSSLFLTLDSSTCLALILSSLQPTCLPRHAELFTLY